MSRANRNRLESYDDYAGGDGDEDDYYDEDEGYSPAPAAAASGGGAGKGRAARVSAAQWDAAVQRVGEVVGDIVSWKDVAHALEEADMDENEAADALFALAQKRAGSKKKGGAAAAAAPAAGAKAGAKAAGAKAGGGGAGAKAAGAKAAGATVTPSKQSGKASTSATPAASRPMTPSGGAAAGSGGPPPPGFAVRVASDVGDTKGPEEPAVVTTAALPVLPDDVEDTRPLLNLVVVGHVDAGKSTLMGHLLADLGIVSQKLIHEFERESRNANKASFAYAWVLDQEAEERERGVTMDVAINYFTTENRRFVLLDTPGHRDFVPNMISGAVQADVAVLVVPATQNEFESAFSPSGQTREHAVLVRSAGVKNLVVAVNKMDMVQWSAARFEFVKATVVEFLTSVGYQESNLTVVPVSGLTGGNLARPFKDAALTSWYSGPCLAAAIDALPAAVRPLDQPSRLCVSDVYMRNSTTVVVAGKVEAGGILKGNELMIMPGRKTCGVRGDNCEIGLGGITMEHLSVGQILCHPRYPVPVAMKIKAEMRVMPDLPVPIVPGEHFTMHIHCAEEVCVVTKLLRTYDLRTHAKLQKRPRMVDSPVAVLVRIKFTRPVPLEVYTAHARLGRFVLRYSTFTVANGIVKKIMK